MTTREATPGTGMPPTRDLGTRPTTTGIPLPLITAGMRETTTMAGMAITGMAVTKVMVTM